MNFLHGISDFIQTLILPFFIRPDLLRIVSMIIIHIMLQVVTIGSFVRLFEVVYNGFNAPSMVLILFGEWACIFYGLWWYKRTVIDSLGPGRLNHLPLLNFPIWIARKTRPGLIITLLSLLEGLKHSALTQFHILFQPVSVVRFALNFWWLEGLHLSSALQIGSELLNLWTIVSLFNLFD